MKIRHLIRAFFISLLWVTAALAADAPPVILLWPGAAPGSEGKVEVDGDRAIVDAPPGVQVGAGVLVNPKDRA